MTGSLALSQQDGAVLLKSGKSTVMRFGGLSARDALGRTVPARMEVSNNEILLVVEDQQAQYPLTVDPTWSQQQELVVSGGAALDVLGWSVAVSGTTAVIGGYPHGSVYVFVQNGDTWSLQQELISSDHSANDEFGSSLALSGTTVVIGAPGKKVVGNAVQGAAYVFSGAGSAWTQQAELTASNGAAEDQFGYSVAVSGTTVVIGAPFKTVGSNVDQGRAYVFAQSGSTWTEQAELTASDGAEDDQFGYAVSASGKTAVIGVNTAQGAAYVFAQSGSAWTQQQELAPSDGAIGTYFGQSVAVSGTTALIGAPGRDTNNPNEGAVYVFVQSGGTWTQRQELTAADANQDDELGFSVALSGTMAVIGAPFKTIGDNSRQGAAYVFEENGGTWTQQQELTASDGATGDFFGVAVGVSETTALVGACYKAVGGNSEQGAAYAFASAATPLTAATMLTPTPGIALTGTSATFTWLPGIGAREYALWVGTTGIGSSNVYNQSGITATSQAVTGMPTFVGTIYVRLLSEIDGVWQSNDYTYTSAAQAVLISPTPGTTLTASSATFTWTAVPGSQGYWLFLGTDGAGSDNLYDSHQLSATSATFSGLPTNGKTIYARVYTRYNGTLFYNDYTYSAWSQPPVITTPAPGTILTGKSVTFTWTAAASGNQGYWLLLGTEGIGSKDLYDSGQQTATSATVSGLPSNGVTIYARVYTRYDGVLVCNDYSYTSWMQPPVMTSPAPGSTLTSQFQMFTWTAPTPNEGYWLFLGTNGVGSKNIFDSNQHKANSAIFSVLPVYGETIYARVYVKYNGGLVYTDYTYATAP